MTQLVARLLLAAQLEAGSLAATPPSVNASLSLQEAQTLPASELAYRVLGLVGTRYREVRRPFTGRLPAAGGFNLAFAAVPRSAGFPGLCRADVIDVYFWPSENGSASGETMVHSVQTSIAFKIVGDTTPLGGAGWNAAYGRRLDDQCAAAGRVYASSAPEGPQSHFFFMRLDASPADAYFAARAIQQAVERARASRVRITCEEDPSERTANACADPRTLVANLDLGSVWGFTVERCATEPASLCVQAGFFAPHPPQVETRRIGVSMRTNASRTDPPPSEFSVSAIHIDHGTIEY